MKKANSNTIAIVGTVGIPACYGGFETLVENLTIRDSPHKVSVYCSSKYYDKKIKSYNGATLHYIPLSANGAQSIPYDIASIFHGLFKGYRNFLILGVSGALVLPIIKFFLPKVRFATNIDGLEWRRDKWGALAKKFLKFSERMAIKSSQTIICDNQAIADYVKSEYGINSSVIAYGGDHSLINTLPEVCNDYYFALCRIEPENNVHTILEAFADNKEELIFVGNWNKSEYGAKLKSKYSKVSNLKLLDPIYDLDILFDYRAKCRGYIHGHSAGGTNPSLVEMMFFRKSIFAFDCSYNRATMENKGTFFTDAESLSDAIRASSNSASADQMVEIAERRYKWSVIRQQYYELFDDIGPMT